MCVMNRPAGLPSHDAMFAGVTGVVRQRDVCDECTS